jgi:hypothetical protein
MPIHPSAPNASPREDELREIEAHVDEIAGLAKADLPVGTFYAQCLNRVVAGLAALGGIVWSRDTVGDLHAEYQVRPGETSAPDDPELARCHSSAVAAALESGKGLILPPHTAPATNSEAANPTPYLLVLAPWDVAGESTGVLEVLQRPGASPAAAQGHLEFLQVVCEMVGEFHRNRLLRTYREAAGEWQQIRQFAEQTHRSLDLKATAYTIANEGRRVTGCDRVSVLVRRGPRFRLVAMSGLDTVNRRANVVRQLERLAEAALKVREPLWHPAESGERPPQIEQALSACLDETHARAVAVLPLAPTVEDAAAAPSAVGALVIEQFYGAFDEPTRRRIDAVQQHASTALSNALELAQVPFARVLRAAGKCLGLFAPRRLPLTLLVLGVLAAAAAALVLVPADFTIEAKGELQPARLRDLYAPAEAVVSELRVRHGQAVTPQQTLLVLRRSELDFEFKRVWGELQTARKRLASVEADRLQNRRETAEDRQRYAQSTAQLEELRESIGGLESQHAILQQQQAELEVHSPLAGEVLTWNLEQLLQARPVTRGQVLLTVADLEGPWRLELRVPDRRIAHVLAAQEDGSTLRDVTYVLATEPGRQLHGALERVGMRTEIGETDGAFVLATVTVDRSEIPELVPGAGVTARIHCGRRAIGYVWFHDLCDAARAWCFF